MMHTVLTFLKCRWFISQNVAFLSTCKKPLNFQKFDKTVDVKSGGNFNISDVFKYFTFDQAVLHYIHQENL